MVNWPQYRRRAACATCSIGERIDTGSSLGAQHEPRARINFATAVGGGEIFLGTLTRHKRKSKGAHDTTTSTESASCIGSGHMADECTIFQSAWLAKAIALGLGTARMLPTTIREGNCRLILIWQTSPVNLDSANFFKGQARGPQPARAPRARRHRLP